VHELFAQMPTMCCHPLRRHQWPRPTFVTLASLLLLETTTRAPDVGAEQTAKLHPCPQQPSVSRPEGRRRRFEAAALPTHVYADAVVPPAAIRISK